MYTLGLLLADDNGKKAKSPQGVVFWPESTEPTPCGGNTVRAFVLLRETVEVKMFI
jgi:hypothetical protein